MIRNYSYNNTPDELPASAVQLLKGAARFMKDKKKRYIQLDAAGKGTMGYWDKNKTVPMYALEVSPTDYGCSCSLIRQEKEKNPHDKLFSLLCGVITFAVLYVILGLLIHVPTVIALAVSGIVGAVVMIGLFLTYFFEYRGFYALLDLYIRKNLNCKLKK